VFTGVDCPGGEGAAKPAKVAEVAEVAKNTGPGVMGTFPVDQSVLGGAKNLGSIVK
jgi:hypothetical protein